MATLNELSSKLQELKGNLGLYEGQKETALKELRTSKADLKNLGKEIRDLEKEIGSYDIVIRNQTDPAQKAELESQRAAKQDELNEAIARRNRIIELGQARSDAEIRIEAANAEIQTVITEFASDPRINAYLQEAIEIKYDEQIEAKKAEKVKKMNLAEKFSLDLKEESAFGTLVSDMVKNYAALKALPTFALDDEAKKNAASVRGAFSKSVNKLKAAIAARPEYADLILTNEDFEAIVAGQNAEGKYEIPTFQEAVATIDRTVADLEARKEKVLGRVRAALAAERIDPVEVKRLEDAIAVQAGLFDTYEIEEKAQDDIIAELEQKISDLKATFTKVDVEAERKAAEDAKKAFDNKDAEVKAKEDEIKGVDDEITDLDTQIAAVGFDQDRLDELTAKADIPEYLTQNKEAAQKDYNDALKALRDKGYIHKNVYPELGSEECKNAFEIFKNADLEVRKAFLNCQTNDSDEAKEALKKAMKDYSNASTALLGIKGMEGLTVENWHDYLVRTITKEAEEGKIDEVYYDGVLKSRLTGIKNEYEEIEGVDSEFAAVENVSDELSKLQEEFLKGNKVDFETDIKTKLTEYKTAMTGLFNSLKSKGAQGLNSIGDLFGKLGAKIATSKFGGFLAKIKNFFTKNKDSKKISGIKSDEIRKENVNFIRDLGKKKDILDQVDLALEDHLEKKLEPDEIDELKDQQAKQEKAKALTDKKADKEAKKADLGTELAGLVDERKDAERIANEKQAEYEAAKTKNTVTPEQQAALEGLEAKKTAATTAKNEAKGKKEAAKAEKTRLEQEKAGLKPERPTSVVDKARNVAHGQGQDLVEEAITSFERDEDR